MKRFERNRRLFCKIAGEIFFVSGLGTLLFTALSVAVDYSILTDWAIGTRWGWFTAGVTIMVMGGIMSRVSRGMIGEAASTYLPLDTSQRIPVETNRTVCHESQTTILSFPSVPITRGGVRGK